MNDFDKVLVIIPARGGSKGIPHKNIKPLNGKPLIYYTIDTARALTSDENICVSTDDLEIKEVVEAYGLNVPFLRPDELASDTAGTYEVLLHALNYFEQQGKLYDAVLLLQVTSPFRTEEHVREAMKLFWSRNDVDMVVSVKEPASNPYYNMYEEDKNGFLHVSKGEGKYYRRQDAPKVYEYNGAVYIMRADELKRTHMHHMQNRLKYVMDEQSSYDLDTMQDWYIAEMIMNNK